MQGSSFSSVHISKTFAFWDLDKQASQAKPDRSATLICKPYAKNATLQNQQLTTERPSSNI
jgi:hypothetical protein